MVNDVVVNVDGLDVSKPYTGVEFHQIIFINGQLDLISDTLYNCFLHFKQMFFGFMPDKQFAVAYCSCSGHYIIRVVPRIMGLPQCSLRHWKYRTLGMRIPRNPTYPVS